MSFDLNIIGPDRPGILSEVSGALLAKGVNVVELETRVGPAPMTGDQTFFAEASILVPATVSMALLQEQLNEVADALALDIRVE